jgi:hypothetical protein
MADSVITHVVQAEKSGSPTPRENNAFHAGRQVKIIFPYSGSFRFKAKGDYIFSWRNLETLRSLFLSLQNLLVMFIAAQDKPGGVVLDEIERGQFIGNELGDFMHVFPVRTMRQRSQSRRT